MKPGKRENKNEKREQTNGKKEAMDRQGLPGIEDLFREHERLARKLSQDELNALRRFVRRTVHGACESVVARMRYLQAAHDANEKQFQLALDTLQKDLDRERGVASEFKREFGSLATVLQARERRHREQHDTMVTEVRQCRLAVREARQKHEELEALLQLKDKEIVHGKDMIVDLEDELAKHKDCLKVKEEVERLREEALRLKLDIEALRKDLRGAETSAISAPASRTRQVSHIQLGHQGNARNKVRFSGPELETKQTIIPAAVSPYCSSPACRARVDLEDCRAQYVKKCQEVALLTSIIEKLKRKSREQRRPLLSTFSVGNASGTAQSTQQRRQTVTRQHSSKRNSNESVSNSASILRSTVQKATR